MIKQFYDIVIVGGGAAAFSAMIKASEASKGNLSIAMITSGEIGGTCVNVGCVPSKYLIEAASKYYYSTRKNYPGIEIGKANLNFTRLMEGLRNVVKELRIEKYEKVLSYYPNVELIKEVARFKSEEV